jgi:hypothetical protein
MAELYDVTDEIDDDPLQELVLSVSEIHRMLYLLNQDLCKTEGAIVVARRKLEGHQNGTLKVSGKSRAGAHRTLQMAPRQIEVLEGAQKALQEALAELRKKELIK